MARIKAVYDNFDTFKAGLQSLKDLHLRSYEAYSPVSMEHLEHLMPSRGSTVRAWATAGAIFGMISFWFMCVASSLIYRIITGGKPPWSNIPFIIVSYEGTILIGSVAAFLAVVVLARLRPRKPPPEHDGRFSGGSFGIEVHCAPGERRRVADVLQKSGATEVHESG